MKLYSYLPDRIQLETGEILKPYVCGLLYKASISKCKKAGLKYLTINVLSLHLRGKTDIRGKPYKADKWLFVEAERVYNEEIKNQQ